MEISMLKRMNLFGWSESQLILATNFKHVCFNQPA